jgi:WD40 repeat protein
MPKLFVSYSSANRIEAESIHAALELDGHEVWRDKTRLETDWSREIALGLAQSEAICLLWSEPAATSQWVRQEFLTARALEKRIFVLFLDKTPLPDPFTTLDGDFTPGGLLDRVRRASDLTASYDFTAAAAPVFIPFRPNAEFRGRHADLLEIYLGMIGNLKRTGISLVGAVGAGGIGKTQLAVEFAWRFAFAFAGVYWIQAADEGSWEQQLVEIARTRLGLSVENQSGPRARHDYLVALQEHCRRTPNVLLIFDNVPDPAQLNSDTLLDGPPPLDLGASVLFTTRRRSALPGVAEHAVDMLSPAAAEQVLTSARPAASPAEQEAVAGICGAAGFLPLALVLIAGLMRKRPRVSYAAYLAELRKKRLGTIDLGQMSAAELATRHLASVEDTLAEQWKTLTGATARRLFRLMGFFPETAIVPKARLGLCAGLEFSGTLEDPLEDAFRELHDLHLMEDLEKGAAARLHPLVRDFAERLTPEPRRNKERTQAAQTLSTLYLDPECLQRQAAERGIDAVIEDFQLALSWDAALTEEARDLHRVLERERHHLRLPNVSLAIQIQHRAACMNLPRLSERYAARNCALRTTFVSHHDDPAWVRSMVGAGEEAYCVAISPDGGTGISGFVGKPVLWNLRSGQLVRRLSGPMLLTDAAITSDGRYAICAQGSSLTIHDLVAGELIWENRSPGGDIETLAWTPDRRFAVTGHTDGLMQLWDIERREVIRRFQDPENEEISSLALDSDGRRFIASNRQGKVRLYDIDGPEPVREFGPPPGRGTQWVALAPDGQTFVTGASGSGTMALWSIASSAPVHVSEDSPRGVTALAITPDGKYALAGNGGGVLVRWNLQLRELDRVFEGHNDAVRALAIAPDGSTALTGSEDKTLILWDLTSPEPDYGESHWGRVHGLAFSLDGRLLLSGASDTSLILWDVAERRCLRKFKNDSRRVEGVALSGDGARALAGDDEGGVTMWDLKAFKPLHRYEGLGDDTSLLAFVFDRPCILARDGEAGVIRALDTGERKHVRFLPTGQYGGSDGFSFSNDGRRALSCANDSVTLWDLENGEVLRQWPFSYFSGDSVTFYRAALTQNDTRLITVGGDNSVTVWDMESGRVVTRVYLSSPTIAVAAHQSTIAVGDSHGKVYFLTIVN